MKPQLLTVSTQNSQSFSARVDVAPDVNTRWHYHKEVELIYICKGTGTKFIGDSMTSFAPGQLVMIGSFLPHYWRFDSEFYTDKQKVEVLVIHFDPAFLGDTFLSLPENSGLVKLLKNAQRGLMLPNVGRELIDSMINLTSNRATPAERIILLLRILAGLADALTSTLASASFEFKTDHTDKDRLKMVYDYTFQHFKRKITLDEIAAVAKVSGNAFCKYFKLRTKKTYQQFVNEIRIGHACKLLQENELNVKEVCYESGFFNFASFHKHFKSIVGMSPLAYQKHFLVSR